MRNKYLLFAFLSCLCLSLNAQMTFWSDGSIGLLQKVNNNGLAINSLNYFDYPTLTITPIEAEAKEMYGINNNGNAAGSMIYDFASNTYVPAFKLSGSWMSIDFVMGVGEPVDGSQGTAKAISENGNYVTGIMYGNSWSVYFPFIYNTMSGSVTRVGSASTTGTGYDVNNSGMVTGVINNSGTGGIPFYYDGTIHYIGQENGITTGEAYGISDSGLIVGKIGNGDTLPFIYDTNSNELKTINIPAGFSTGEFLSVSENGIAIGHAGKWVDGGWFPVLVNDVIIYHPSLGNSAILLKDLLASRGIDINSLDGAMGRGTGISPDGNYITGYFQYLNGWVVETNDSLFPENDCTIDCPENIEITLPVDQTSATVDYGTLNISCGSSSSSGLTIELVEGPESGSEFPMGTTLVTHHLVDGDGNILYVCSFTVTLKDAYCTVGTNISTVEPITHVLFEGIDNTTPADIVFDNPRPYLQYFMDETSATVEAGSTYPITLEGNTNGNNTSQFTVFVDWNHNMALDNAGEVYTIGSLTNSTGTDGQQLIADIAVPADALSGATRMRIIKSFLWGDDTPVTDPCSISFYNGQIEDYTVVVGGEEGCLEAEYGQWPSTAFTPGCTGTAENVTGVGYAGEFSQVNVVAGTEYTFSSSVATDYITISDEAGTTVYASGTTPVVWTATADEIVRFYTHLDDECTSDNTTFRARRVLCGEAPTPPTNDDCANAIALACGDSDTGNTTLATDSGGYPAGDVFYSFTGTGSEQTVTVSLCGSSYDTVLRIFTDCTLSTEVAMNDDNFDACTTSQSQLEFTSDGTSTYYIMIEGYGSATGAYTINLTCENTPVEEGCLNADPDLPQWPTSTFIPSCNGTAEVIASNCWTGEYSMVQVTAGTEYTFSSSVATDMVTISDEAGTTVYAAGVSAVNWTAPADGLVRFYLHLDEDCNWGDDVNRSRMVQCGELPPPQDGCLTASFGQYPSATFVPACIGTPQSITDLAYAGEYSMVQVTAGTEYIFSSSVATDFITIGNEAGDTVIAYGQSPLTWTADADQLVRFYTHVNDSCLEDTNFRSRMVQCGEVPPPPSACEDFVVLSNNLEDGLLFGGGTAQHLAADVPVADEGFTVYGMEPTIIGEASTFTFIFYEDAGGLPGAEIGQREGTILDAVETGENSGFIFYKYTIGFDSPIDFEANTTYWIEIQSDALAWEIESVTMLGNDDVFYNTNVGEGVWTPTGGDELVFNLVCEPLAVNDMNSFDFTYYPNPVKDYLMIDARKNIENISVYNLAGQSVLQNVKAVNGKVNMSSLSPGVYVFRVTLEGGQVETFKVIKK